MSNTFASSLWALDTLFNLADIGVDGINFHTLPGAPYEPFVFTRTVDVGRERAPGVLRDADVRRGRPARSPAAADRRAGRTREGVGDPQPDGRQRIVLINKDPTTSVDVHVALPGSTTSGTVEWLSASGLTPRAASGSAARRSARGPTTGGLVAAQRRHRRRAPRQLHDHAARGERGADRQVVGSDAGLVQLSIELAGELPRQPGDRLELLA